ncbi:hypothetical protein V865_001998 [Kwoniella europaea PYCC6329]|uniref:Saccharopine dehydrogenase NADP binding domain-containing protein n=1 Tax=Kwoniella europaea PYCC6329 TaxID=1423913 RepID=A0AAX4KEH1_9TREE
MTSKPTLIIYGATSFTARNLLSYLDTHPEGDSFEFILSGRNQQKLEIANGRLQRPREVVSCQLDDEDGVKKLVEKGQVVVNLAGPFRWHNAEALIRECCRTGKHYIDLCGESSWLATDIIPKYDNLAKETGAIIVPSCGFDSIPSDLSLWLAHKTLQSQYPHLTIQDSTSFFKLKGGSMSGGTIQSMHSLAELPKDKRRSGEYDCIPSDGRIVKSVSPVKLLYSLSDPTEKRKRRYVSLTTGAGIRYGEKMNYAESMDIGRGWIGSTIFSLVLSITFGLFFLSSFVRKLSNYVLPKTGEGVSDEKLFKASYVVDNLSISTPSTDGQTMKVWTKFKADGDPGYLSTCYLLAESGLSILLDLQSLPPITKQGGLLTPSIAFGDILLDRLNRSGKFQITSEIVDTSDNRKID